MDKPLCRHCNRTPVTPGHRGLCFRCHGDLSIREQYPSMQRGRQSQPNGTTGEETEEELDAIIAEQLPTMPRGHEEEYDQSDRTLRKITKRRDRRY